MQCPLSLHPEALVVEWKHAGNLLLLQGSTAFFVFGCLLLPVMPFQGVVKHKGFCICSEIPVNHLLAFLIQRNLSAHPSSSTEPV